MRIKSTTKLLLFSALATAIQFLCINAVLPVMLYSDDYLAELALSGAYNGTTVVTYPFYNLLLIRGVGLLYRIISSIPWLSIFLFSTLIGSCWVIRYSIYSVCTAKRIPLWVAEMAVLCYFFTALFNITSPLTFTLISGVCGTAAVCLTLAAGLTKERRTKNLICSCLMLWLSYVIRADSAKPSLCYFGLVVFLFYIVQPLLNRDPRYVKTIISSILAAAVMLGGCWGLSYANKTLRDNEDAQDISRWNYVRSEQLDFHALSYKTNSSFFESIGWNEEFYDLEEYWYLLDEKCDYDHYRAIVQHSPQKTSNISFVSTIEKTGETLYSFYSSVDLLPLIVLYAVFFLLSILLSFAAEKRKKWLFILFIICATGGCILMLLYLSYIGRLPGRLFRMISITPVACLILTALYLWKLPEQTRERVASSRRLRLLLVFAYVLTEIMMLNIIGTNLPLLILVTLLLGLVLFAGFAVLMPRRFLPFVFALCLGFTLAGCVSLSIFHTRDECTYHLERQQKYISEQSYVASHPDDIFVSSRFITSQLSMLPVRLDLVYSICEDRTNLFYSDDFLLFSDAYDEKLEQAGLDELNIDSYFTDDIYFIGNTEDDETVSLLLDYMRTQYGDSVRAEVCDELDGGVSVYRFRK